MISDHLDNTDNYYSISKYFKKSFEFIKSLDTSSTIGLHKIDSNLNAYVMEYWTSKEFVHGWESHRKYIDIQYCLIGKERIQWTYKNENIIETTNYNEDNDVMFYKGIGEKTYIDTGNGVFAIFFPNDLHAPQLMLDQPELIKKVVIKVPIL